MIYDRMESQSGRCLPLIYQPFDIGKRSHWADRGACWDFVHSVGEGQILDFGPGDGWPSLIVAPYVERVVGVDASARRVVECRTNAERMGITNTKFVHVPAGEKLPFAEASFDGVMAASAVEQTPDPQATIRELYRVLKPGGKLRICYESLNRYRGGREKEIDLWPIATDKCLMLIYDRRPDDEEAVQYVLDLKDGKAEIEKLLQKKLPIEAEIELPLNDLEMLRPLIGNAWFCVLRHPAGPTWQQLLVDIGFTSVVGTRDGSHYAAEVFDRLEPDQRPVNLVGVDELLGPQVKSVIQMEVSLADDPWIIATK
jgi:ubiquinone/menaquinone biosynthesis C-methylase UbiE